MSDQWIHQNEIILKTMEQLTSKQDRDRLELINSMLFALQALNQSVHGWQKWIQSLNFMSKFSVNELQEMEAGLISTVRSFIEYDLDVTKRHENKFPQIRQGAREQKDEDGSTGIYA
ncbi:MAG: DUF2153 family protein [Planctomycetota bacterium]